MRLTSYLGRNKVKAFFNKSDCGFSFVSALLFVMAVTMVMLVIDSYLLQKRKLIEKEAARLDGTVEVENRQAEALYESL